MKKKTMKRNQIIIGALTVLLGVAGYINFSGNKIDLAPGEKEQTESAFAEEQIQTITDADSLQGEVVPAEVTVSGMSSGFTASASATTLHSASAMIRSIARNFFMVVSSL